MPLTKVGRLTVFYGILIAEVAAISGSYYVWHNMNVDQEYRRKMSVSHPRVLEAFYKSCTLVGIYRVKENDIEAWKKADSK